LAERIRVALGGGMTLRKTAAKFEVNLSTVHALPALSMVQRTQASPRRQ